MVEIDSAHSHYVVGQAIGVGSVTESFVAATTGLQGFQKKLVVKRLHPKWRSDEAFVAAFLRAAKRSLVLSHAGLVEVLDLGQGAWDAEREYFLVTELVLGLSLRELTNRVRSLGQLFPLPLVELIGAEIARTLDYAHRKHVDGVAGVCHGNLSLQNVLLSQAGEVKITDFCLADALTEHNHKRGQRADDDFVAVPLFSPEQLDGEAPTVKSDIFALGALLYCLLDSGHTSETGGSIAERELAFELTPIEIIRHDTPPRLARLISRCLAISPEERPSHAAEVYDELITCMGQRDSSGSERRWLSADIVSFTATQEAVTYDLELRQSDVRSLGSARGSDLAPDSGPCEAENGSLLVVDFDHAASEELKRMLRGISERYSQHAYWLTPTRLCLVFVQEDGRDTEFAVRAGLALMRVIRSAGEPVSVIVDRSNFAVEASGWPALTFSVQAESLANAAQSATGQLAVTRRAARQLRNLFRLKQCQEDVLAVVAARSPTSPLAKFVGRSAELEWLHSEFDQATAADNARVARAAVVGGAAGIGKTRLLSQFVVECDSLNEGLVVPLKVRIAACPPRGGVLPYSAVLAVLARLCEVHEGEAFSKSDEVSARLKKIGLSSDDATALGHWLQVAPEQSGIASEELAAVLGRVLQTRSTHTRRVIVLDNAQQVDPASVAVFERAWPSFEQQGTGFIISTRNPDIATLFAWASPKQLSLRPLGARETEEYILSRLNVVAAPHELFSYVFLHSGGNPFYADEILREAVAQGLIILGRDRVRRFDKEHELRLPHFVVSRASSGSAQPSTQV